MKSARTLILSLAAAGLLCTAYGALAKPVPLEPRVMLTQSQLARLQAIAGEGADALRQYLWRTRMIYGWTWQDLVAGA